MTLNTSQTISYPRTFPPMLKMSNAEFVEELRFLAAAKLFELGRLSAGKAAQLAEMKRIEFLYRLGSIGVSVINLNEEEIELAIKMVDSRNSVVHIYLETFAEEIYVNIKEKYYNLLEKILKILKNQE